jgi:hypothetical protein
MGVACSPVLEVSPPRGPGCMSSFGPPELRRIGRCNARSSLRAPRTSRDAARTSRLVFHRRYTHIEGRCLLAGLGSAAAACSHKGTAVARPLDQGAAGGGLGTAASTPDRGTATTARRGRGAAATAATGRGSTAARVSHPDFRVQNPGANIITRCAGTKSHTYDESWHRIECHIFTI